MMSHFNAKRFPRHIGLMMGIVGLCSWLVIAAPAVAESPPPVAAAPLTADEAGDVQQRWASYLETPVQTRNSTGMELCLIPPGRFTMGTSAKGIDQLVEQSGNPSRAAVFGREHPPHEVSITRPFYMGRTSVTVEQFRAFVEATGHITQAQRGDRGGFGMIDRKWTRGKQYTWSTGPGFPQADDHPVVNVSWNDAVAFCRWLSDKEGVTYRLPTEAQWEYACRAGTTTPWYCGEDESELEAHAWYRPNSDWQTHPVAEKKPNAFGLYDMIGNARNWCADWYGEDYYARSPVADPAGPPTGEKRIVRGAAVHARASFLRSAMRYADPPEHCMGQLGFRVVRDLMEDSDR